jgi:hypothetical protein
LRHRIATVSEGIILELQVPSRHIGIRRGKVGLKFLIGVVACVRDPILFIFSDCLRAAVAKHGCLIGIVRVIRGSRPVSLLLQAQQQPTHLTVAQMYPFCRFHLR